MPHVIHIDSASRTAFVELTGTVDGAEIITACREVFTHPDWECGFSTLWDTRHLRVLLLLPEDLSAFAVEADAFRERRGPGRTAFVATDVDVKLNALVFGMKLQPGSSRSFRLFSSIAEAEEWLAQSEGWGMDEGFARLSNSRAQ